MVSVVKMIYEIAIISNKRLSFIPHDLRYFNANFICERMGARWRVPEAEIYGRSYPVPDFVAWMHSAPIISEKAKISLHNLCENFVEYLPFYNVKGVQLFALNVLSMDVDSPIFKKSRSGPVFVDDRFGSIILNECLTGVELADPNDDIDRKVAMGESVNVFPGLKI